MHDASANALMQQHAIAAQSQRNSSIRIITIALKARVLERVLMQVREDEAKKCAGAKEGTPAENAGAATHVGGPKKNAGV